ncbi:hypothetical protein CF327_g132 [Tilletia walkeri]|nr:hypothetical protein CF327_g132 [Tilletia walkeri]
MSANRAATPLHNTTSTDPTIVDILRDLQQTVSIIHTRLDGFQSRLGAVEQESPGRQYLSDASQLHHTASPQPQDAPPTSRPPAISTQQFDGRSVLPTTRDLPPHLMQQASTTSPTHPSASRARTSRIPTPPSRAVQVFRDLPKSDKIVFRTVLGTLGLRVSDILNNLDEDDIPETGSVLDDLPKAHALQSRTPSVIHDNNDDAQSQTSPAAIAQATSIPQVAITETQALTSETPAVDQPSLLGLARPLVCKTELLGTFHGAPEKLEGFLSRVRDVVRSLKRPDWEAAVVRALSLTMQDDAAAWHEGLTDEEAARLNTVEAWVEAMRDEFPVNPHVQRRLARDRKWEWTRETAGGYYHHKLRLLRQAYGYDQNEAFLVTEIKEGLPATMRETMRLPNKPALRDLRKELNDREPTWREVHEGAERRNTSASSRPASVLPSRMTGQSLVRSAPTPGLPTQSSGPASSTPPPSLPQSALSLSATYDPKRVTPATNGQARTYKRPDTDQVMVLNRPCHRCNGDHFTFEHQHLVPQVRHIVLDDDDYPVLEDEDRSADSQEEPMLATLSSAMDKGKSKAVDEVPHVPTPVSSTTTGSGLASSRYDANPSQCKTPDVTIQHEPCLHFAERRIFHEPRVMPAMETVAPLARGTHRYGNVVECPAAPDSGTGTGYQSHIPLTARVRINGTDSKALPALIDTGASLTTIDAELLKKLGGRPHGSKMNVTGLGSTHTKGWTTITFFIDASDTLGRHTHLEFTHDFHVLPSFAPGICLGNDFIGQHDLTISPIRGRARIGKYTFEAVERLGGPYAKDLQLVVSDDTTLEAGFQAWVPVGAASFIPDVDYVVSPRLSVTPDETVRLAGPTTVMRHAPRRHLLLGNHGSQSFILRKGTIIADASAARAGDINTTTGESFNLSTSPSSAPASLETPVEPLDSDLTDGDAAMPIDAFEGTEPPGSALMRDAETILVDDAYRVGVQADGTPHPSVVELLRRHSAAFALDGRPGRVEGFDMGISLQPDAALRPEAPRRASPEKKAAMDAAIDQLLDWDVIEPSHSSVSFPVLMIRQYNKWRFCVDYRQLNTHTIPDRYPLATVDAIFQTLSGKKWFSALDAIRGYHQLGVKPEDRWKTAFICHRGLFQYKMVPFGLRNAPAIFQRMMDQILGPLRWNKAVVYIDDSVVATDSLEDHLQALDTLLTSAARIGLKFRPPKCTFAVPSLTLLGRKVSGAGVAIWTDRAKSIRDLPRPTTLQDLYHVLGLFGYYRAFIHKFAEIAAPLTRSLRGWRYETNDGVTRLVNTEGKALVASRVPVEWTDLHQRSFERLRDAIANPPTLAHPDPSKPYVLYVDASKDAFATILH